MGYLLLPTLRDITVRASKLPGYVIATVKFMKLVKICEILEIAYKDKVLVTWEWL